MGAGCFTVLGLSIGKSGMAGAQRKQSEGEAGGSFRARLQRALGVMLVPVLGLYRRRRR